MHNPEFACAPAFGMLALNGVGLEQSFAAKWGTVGTRLEEGQIMGMRNGRL